MAMAHFDVSLAYDQIVKRGVPGQVARVSDAETDLPYTDLLDLDGNPLAALVSNSQGYVPPFQIQDGPALVKMSVGGVTYYLQDLNLFGETAQAAQQAAADAQKAAQLVEAPADEVVATLVQGDTLTQTAGDARWVTNAGADSFVSNILDQDGSATQIVADARYASKATATNAADGLMPKADKSKLDGATSAATASRVVIRDAAGRAKFASPSAADDAANKTYVDAVREAVDAVKLPYKGKLATDGVDTYPVGYSEGLFAAADGWPHASFSNVVTFHPPGYSGGTVQWAYAYTNVDTPPIWRQASNATGSPWGPWYTAASTDEAGRIANQAITSTYKPTAGSTPEHYLTIFRNGDKVPGSVRRIVGGNSNATAPPQETIESYYAKTGASVIINGSGWWASTGNRLMGLSIKDGVLIQGWENTGDLGSEATVIMRDGELRVYAKATTPDPATIIAEGGYNSFSWGAAAYRNGTVTDFRTKYTRYNILSARQCIGSTKDGHIFILTFPGVTGTSGATGDGIVAAAQATGLTIQHLYILDGGGSAQTMLQGEALVQSSDVASRPVPDALYFYGPVSSNRGRGPVYRFLRASGTNSVPNEAYTPLNNMSTGPGDNPDCSVTLNGITFTVRETGVYSIEAQILFPNNANGSRYAAIIIDGTNRYRGMAVAGSGAFTAPVNVTLRLNAGSTVELQAYQNSGNSLTLPADADGTRLSILRVR